MTRSALMKGLAESLSLLSADSAHQISYLTELGVADLADELALEFDAAFSPFRHRRGVGAAKRLYAACRRVDEALKNPTSGWYFEDLDSQPWREVRAAAAAALAEFPD